MNRRRSGLPLMIAGLILLTGGCRRDPIESTLDSTTDASTVSAETGPGLGTDVATVPRERATSRFVDRIGGYALRYPSSWRLEDHSRGSAMIRADLSRDRTLGLQVRMYESVRAPFDRYVTTYVERFRSDMSGRWGGQIRQTARRCGPLGRHRGCQVTLAARRRDGQQWTFKQYLWPRGQRIYAIQAGTVTSERERNEPVLDAVARSFSFSSSP